MNSALSEGDDSSSLSVQGGQKSVFVTRDARDIKSGCTCMAWRPGGDSFVVGCKDGSLQWWDYRATDYKPVELLTRQTPKHEWQADKSRPKTVAR